MIYELIKLNIRQEAKNTLEEERLIQSFDTNGTVLANALSSNNTNPLIVQHETSYYVATPNLFDWMSHYVGEMLFSYFSQNQRKIKLKLIYALRMFTRSRYKSIERNC